MGLFRTVINKVFGGKAPPKPPVASAVPVAPFAPQYGPGVPATPTQQAPAAIPIHPVAVPLTRLGRKILSDRQLNFIYAGEKLVHPSSNVQYMVYNYHQNKLYITFLNNSQYEYENVSESEANTFFLAISKGRTVWDLLRIRGTKKGHRKPYRQIR